MRSVPGHGSAAPSPNAPGARCSPAGRAPRLALDVPFAFQSPALFATPKCRRRAPRHHRTGPDRRSTPGGPRPTRRCSRSSTTHQAPPRRGRRSGAGTRSPPTPTRAHHGRSSPAAVRGGGRVLSPHMPAPAAAVAAHRHHQRRRSPPERRMRQPAHNAVAHDAFTATTATPPIRFDHPTRQHRPAGFDTLTDHLQPQPIKPAARSQVTAGEGSVAHGQTPTTPSFAKSRQSAPTRIWCVRSSTVNSRRSRWVRASSWRHRRARRTSSRPPRSTSVSWSAPATPAPRSPTTVIRRLRLARLRVRMARTRSTTRWTARRRRWRRFDGWARAAGTSRTRWRPPSAPDPTISLPYRGCSASRALARACCSRPASGGRGPLTDLLEAARQSELDRDCDRSWASSRSSSARAATSCGVSPSGPPCSIAAIEPPTTRNAISRASSRSSP